MKQEFFFEDQNLIFRPLNRIFRFKNKAAGIFVKKWFYLIFLVVLVDECNFDLSSGLPETRENWQLCQIVQQKSLLPFHYDRNFQILSRNYF